ncbi:hypothetical protein [Pseudobutyrivibrio ruminis]|uniref:Uncharacterized protein n=1 Tax=Pseudobutyrivibrio ruminis DSM 9787 TaxID=1123011 RepID=A0A285T6J8_9FIRM|nr:hypothetical protein [Pseudobutyrivibrio ruminis]SOC16445.1 hypothetical protein SAMN02910411_0403 [Pseudobutyrivibrio ruminis DSM 9787]
MNKMIKPGMMKYCVVANIKSDSYCDKNGFIRYGTKVFPAGRKIYLSRRLWKNGVVAMGLNRYKSRYDTDTVPLDLVENIRVTRTFKPSILIKMGFCDEYIDMWWSHRAEDFKRAQEYAEMLNCIKNGDITAFDRYFDEVMVNYC